MDGVKPLFIQLNDRVKDEGIEWKETARWIKFEETLEQGGKRWSKPHVGAMSLHYVFQLQETIKKCQISLDLQAKNLEDICDSVLQTTVTDGLLNEEQKKTIIRSICGRHKTLPDNALQQTILPAMRTIIKTASSAKLGGNASVSISGNFNRNIYRKIQREAETANILVGEFPELIEPVCAFVRLRDALILPNVTEVPVPTRFIFMYLGPPASEAGHLEDYHEIGRAVGCIMSEELFARVAYSASNRDDLLSGLDNFLHELTVLPPGKWDPSIRVEPPAKIPAKKSLMKVEEVDEEEEAFHLRLETGLVRTGKLFGGLINDIKRKAPHYLSDFTDGLSMQCIATYFFIYFACLTPIVTFGGLLGDATENRMAAMESLMAGLVVGVGYGLFSGQPLTIMGSTGPILVFESMIYRFCKGWEWDYLSFRLCIGVWVGILLFVLVAFDASAYVCYITRFTEENFALLIAMIFIVKAVENIIHIGEQFPMHPSECYCSPENATMLEVVGVASKPNFTELNATQSHESHGLVHPCEV